MTGLFPKKTEVFRTKVPQEMQRSFVHQAVEDDVLVFLPMM